MVADWAGSAANTVREFIGIALAGCSLRLRAAGWIVATVIAHGVDIGKVLIEKGWARPYEGGKKEPWCTAASPYLQKWVRILSRCNT